jgi:hypothetical protein
MSAQGWHRRELTKVLARYIRLQAVGWKGLGDFRRYGFFSGKHKFASW